VLDDGDLARVQSTREVGASPVEAGHARQTGQIGAPTTPQG